jgi:hypothetical protein
MTNKYLEKTAGILSAAKKVVGDVTGANVRNAAKAMKTSKTKSYIELDRDLKAAAATHGKVRKIGGAAAAGAAAGAVGGAAGEGIKKMREKSASDNVYLEKIAKFPTGAFGKKVIAGAAVGGLTGAVVAGKDDRIKGALGGAAAGGIAGSVFGRIAQAKRMKNVFPASSTKGAGAKLLNPKMISARSGD